MRYSVKLTGALLTAALGCSLLAAQDLKLTREERKNQEIAIIEFKDMNQYHHFELAEKYIAPGYIQHNPNFPQGRDGYVKTMTRDPSRIPEPIQSEWKIKPRLVLTSGDIVLVMFDRTAPDPLNPGQTYVYNSYDMARVENGQVQEHWDAVKKNAPAPSSK